MKIQFALYVFFVASIFTFAIEAASSDPYKVLGVERTASQREIQKAFHKLSLQYHPDKNKSKGAQAKFAEINNAYEILSDEEKRKNYDQYGDEKGAPRFATGGPGDHGGYTYFTSGGQAHNGFRYRPNEWQNSGSHGNSESFSFSFGNPGAQSSSGFGFGGMNDILSNLFGGNSQESGQFGGFSSSTGSHSRSRSSTKSIASVNSKVFKKEIAEQGMTWLLLSYTPKLKGYQYYQNIVEQVASSLEGALKAGTINCETEPSLCNELGILPRKAPRVFIYSYKGGSGSLAEYNGDLNVQSLKSLCREHLPKFSKRTDLSGFDISAVSEERLPRVMLLSTKKDTPVIWRVLSGLYHKRFIFYDTEIQDASDSKVKKLGIDALPAVVGWLLNGEKHVLQSSISVKDMKSAVKDLSALLDGFEKKNKKASNEAKKEATKSHEEGIPLLTETNFDAACGENTPVCLIGGFRSSKSRKKLESILSDVSKKSLSRKSSQSISYALLDSTKHSTFLKSFDKSGFESSDKLLVAYKPRKAKFAVFGGEMDSEEVEKFVSAVLNGDVKFNKTRQKPTFNEGKWYQNWNVMY